MIQVQIAATVERAGLSGLRWVLVDDREVQRTARARAQPAADARGGQTFNVPDAGSPVRRATLGVHVACAAVLLCALGSAWWVSSVMHGAAPTTSASAGAAATSR